MLRKKFLFKIIVSFKSYTVNCFYDLQPSETSGKQKEKSRGKQKEKSSSKKTGTGKKEKQTGWNFDFENPPEETTWSLVDGTWKPSIGGDPVPEETVQQWAETFELVCTME